jgi:hypothetical protein
MNVEHATMVRVQVEWNGWRTASVRLSDIQEIHWYQPAGAPRPLVHGYVSCSSIVTGELPHTCDVAPHRLLVCVLRVHASEAAYAELERRADARAIKQVTIDRPARTKQTGAWLYTH